MKILFYGYRDWSFKIFENINITSKYLVTSDDYSIIEKINPDLVFFIGWSNIIPDEIVNNYKCICLHPSPLPKYRGGSPIQHQIINGEESSAVSLFIMNEILDGGDILFQKEISLSGELSDVFNSISEVGAEGVNFIIENHKDIENIRVKQDELTPTLKRRKPSDSEITIEEIQNSTPKQLHNKIRSLTDPYPNAYIKCKDGEKLFLLKTKI